ncbi:MAG: HAD-IC family P-type ATPase, partial [Firmicutes bacterium]|nr:HAD-IC family P-type ATPase [Bacillota bacterium]
MNKKEKKLLKQIIYSIIFLLLALILPINGYLKIVLYLISYYFVGKNVYVKSIKNIKNKEIFDENFLMLIATIGAFSINDFLEGVLVMLLYQIGELFQSYAVNKSRKSISSLMDVRPDYANILENGKLKKISPYKVKIDDVIVVKTGEKIPLDGIVIEGSSYVDKSYLTGESVPVKVTLDDEVLSGCINKEGLLQIRVTKEFKQSTVSKILDLVENANSKKAKSENFITKFARIYTPIVVILALLLALV